MVGLLTGSIDWPGAVMMVGLFMAITIVLVAVSGYATGETRSKQRHELDMATVASNERVALAKIRTDEAMRTVIAGSGRRIDTQPGAS